MFLIFSKKRRQRLVDDAERSRHDELNRAASICIVIVYNLIGLLDIVSTTLALALGGAEEANPILRYMMENAGAGWIAAKLFLQAAVSLMVLWFPHRFVLIMFTMAVLLNGAVVINNFQIVAMSSVGG